jgi:hypothetical protein
VGRSETRIVPEPTPPVHMAHPLGRGLGYSDNFLGDDPSERRYEPPNGAEWEEWAIYFITSDPVSDLRLTPSVTDPVSDPVSDEALQQMAKTLEGHRAGLLAYYDVMISSGPMERTNNKIQTMKRQAYGFRDLEFFKLKILAIHETKYALVG